MAELVFTDSGESSVGFWNPVDRHEPKTWTPIELPFSFAATESSSPTLTVTVDGKERQIEFPTQMSQQMELGTQGDWVVRPRLLKVSGVAECFIQGGDRKQYQILVDPTALVDYGVTLQDVQRVLEESNINTSGGYAITGESERPIRVLGRVGPDARRVVEDLSAVPVKVTNKRSVLLGQVATITEGPEFKRGDGAINCLLYTSPSPRDQRGSRMPSSA